MKFLVCFRTPGQCLTLRGKQTLEGALSVTTITVNSIYRERAMELKLTGIALNLPKNHIGGKKYTREVRWVIFI